MKKILSILLVIVFVSSQAFVSAESIYRSTDKSKIVKQYIMTNLQVSGTATTLKENISSTSLGILTAGQRILGYTISPCGTTGGDAVRNSETVFAIYDTTSVENISVDKLEAEAESLANEPKTVIFPYPYEIQEGVTVYLGTNAVLTIYYETTY